MSMNWLGPDTGARDPRQILFDAFKGIIDGEWGPYPESEYWELADEVMRRMGLQPDITEDDLKDAGPAFHAQVARERLERYRD